MRRTYLWLGQLATGVLVAVLLSVHMANQHLNEILGFFGVSEADPASWAATLSRARETIWAVLYIALLAVVLYHGLYGLRNIVLELSPPAKTVRIITYVIVAVGVVSFAGGAYVPIVLLFG